MLTALIIALAVAVLATTLVLNSSGSSRSGNSAPAQAGSSAEQGSQAGDTGAVDSATGPDAITANSGFDGAALPAGLTAPGFTLIDQYGQSISPARYRGQVIALAFLYSTCGRVCILLAQQVRGALDELARPVPVLFVSADPARDSAASVARFLSEASLTGRVQYLTGPLTELRKVWREYHVTPPEDNLAGFENTIALFLIDRRGDERVLFQLEELTPEAVGHDLRSLAMGG